METGKEFKDLCRDGNTASRLTAVWSVSLNCDCPSCKMCVDLLNYPDFWDGRDFHIGENCTERSKGVEVACPECNHEFEVDLEY